MLDPHNPTPEQAAQMTTRELQEHHVLLVKSIALSEIAFADMPAELTPPRNMLGGPDDLAFELGLVAAELRHRGLDPRSDN
jgi:hypothetical protein